MQEKATYNYKVVRQFSIVTIVWGIVGMTVGVLLAAQLMFPDLTHGVAWLSYGRLRPLHTNAVIFAFGGSALFATSYYVVQRTCHTRLFCDRLAAFTFWGWQAVIVAAALTLPLGITTSHEYARAGMADRHSHHAGVGRLCNRCFSAPSRSARCRTSTWPTGFSVPSS
jgi:cytochrome c oxidase cbb3-type subunit 1